MANIILTGATGTIGRDTLIRALESPRVSHVTVLSRRPLEAQFQDHPKIKVIEHKDFLSYPPSLLSQLSGSTACIWALGPSSVGIKEADYRIATVDYPVAAAKAFAKLSDESEGFTFVYVSGGGITWQPSRFTPMYGRIKGEAEQALAALPTSGFTSLRIHSLRPNIVWQTNPKPNLGAAFRISRTLLQPIWVPSAYMIQSSQLGDAMLRMADPKEGFEADIVNQKGGNTEQGVWSNVELLKLAKL